MALLSASREGGEFLKEGFFLFFSFLFFSFLFFLSFFFFFLSLLENPIS